MLLIISCPEVEELLASAIHVWQVFEHSKIVDKRHHRYESGSTFNRIGIVYETFQIHNLFWRLDWCQKTAK